eukprot:TRINITY_DN4809_c0_g2_i1.p1 TRINITY_DN4809_c0_g2~~TRINITY_DN4809_c0_g2_i1.p1  ORF type:complete len:487 (-),score=173.72 TRINITY_DN4809_c0_g2_i1:87-1502(-)
MGQNKGPKTLDEVKREQSAEQLSKSASRGSFALRNQSRGSMQNAQKSLSMPRASSSSGIFTGPSRQKTEHSMRNNSGSSDRLAAGNKYDRRSFGPSYRKKEAEPVMSDADASSKIKGAITEFLNIKETSEVIKSIEEAKNCMPPTFAVKFIKEAYDAMCNAPSKLHAPEIIPPMVASVLKKGIPQFTDENFIVALDAILVDLDDMICDCPLAASHLAALVVECIVEAIVEPTIANEHLCYNNERINQSKVGLDMMKNLYKRVEEEAFLKYAVSGCWIIQDFLSPMQRSPAKLSRFISSKGLQFLIPYEKECKVLAEAIKDGQSAAIVGETLDSMMKGKRYNEDRLVIDLICTLYSACYELGQDTIELIKKYIQIPFFKKACNRHGSVEDEALQLLLLEHVLRVWEQQKIETEFGVILFAFYSMDLTTEDPLLLFRKEGLSDLKNKAMEQSIRFYQWLENAEDDESDGSDSD